MRRRLCWLKQPGIWLAMVLTGMIYLGCASVFSFLPEDAPSALDPLWFSADHRPFQRNEITFTADSGFEIVLFGYELGRFNGGTIPDTQVLDAAMEVVFSDSDIDAPAESHYTADFSESPLVSTTLTIVTGGGGAVGIDNIRFGQQAIVPEPSTATMLALAIGMSCLAGRRRA